MLYCVVARAAILFAPSLNHIASRSFRLKVFVREPLRGSGAGSLFKEERSKFLAFPRSALRIAEVRADSE